VTHFFDPMNLEVDRIAVARENDSPAGARWAALFSAQTIPHSMRME
jgi:hypothetical protein